MATTKRTFVFDTQSDADLLAALDDLGNGEKSGVVRVALRRHFKLQESHPVEPTIADVIKRLDHLQDDIARLRQNGVAAGDGSASGDDDDSLTEALLGLGL